MRIVITILVLLFFSTFIKAIDALKLFTPHNNNIIICGDSCKIYTDKTKGKFMWSTNDTLQHIIAISAGFYKLTIITNTDTISDSVNVTFHPIPTESLTFSNDTANCSNILLMVPYKNNLHYKWSTLDTNYYKYTEGTGTYWIEISNQYCTKRDSINFKILSPTINLYYKEEICNGTYTIHATSDFDNSTYLWSTGEISEIINVSQTGNYTVTVTNQHQCKSNKKIEIDYIEKKAKILLAPNVFTPNKDGVNDLFGIKLENDDISVFHLLIFDRWGKEVYESDDKNFKWDGTRKNGENYSYSDLANEDTYYWIIKYKTNCIGSKIEKTDGFVRLIR